ncbi:MAG TPA: glycosyltransferase family 4 protein [Steroidobacteraceae bacterium]|nr:glycosyltransferase family 4 protein [Steroidobacteraceae bacterium]
MSVGNALLVSYRPDQAAYRYRMGYLPRALEQRGWNVRVEKLPSRRYVLRILERRALWRWADVVVFQKIKFSPLETALLRRYVKRRVFDLDDAIYLRRPRVPGGPAEFSRWRFHKFASTCRAMDAVVVGNPVLEAMARPYCPRVVVLPTTLDASRYQRRERPAGNGPTVVWVGNPENLDYLELVRGALERLCARLPGLTLRIVSSAFPDWPRVRIERVPWSSEAETEALATADMGIMPLTDDDWARGKCAFKLLQYMAAGLPCIASPVGANNQAVVDNVTGFLAANEAQWETAIERLATDPALARQLGAAGRHHLDAHYSLERYLEGYERLLAELAGAP